MTYRLRSNSRNRLPAGLFGAAAILATTTSQAQVLPSNPDPTCVVSQSEFQGWFGGKPGLNQPVQTADSIGLDTSSNCNFYKWSAQMFLWLTSPAVGQYQGSRIFASQVFYQIANDGLIPQTSFRPLNLALRAAKSGPDGLPIVVDAKGHLREFVSAPSETAHLTTRLAIGGMGPEAIASVKTASDGKAAFLDAKGASVQFTPKVTAAMLTGRLARLTNLVPQSRTAAATAAPPSPQRIAEALTAKHVLIRIATAKGTSFVEAGTGIVVNLGPGQAGGNGVLVSQANVPVYYEVLANDVYAWYLTGRKTPNGIAPLLCNPSSSTCNPVYGLFPTTAPDLQTIVNFAKANGGPSSFPDGKALAVEAKLSWVDASTLPNKAQGYITAPAFLPTYNTSNSADWSPAGTRLATVALVGAHIVGSAKGHPEMVWATFEHQANTPLAQFQYTSGGRTVTVPQTTTGKWLFSASGASSNFNYEYARFDTSDGHIVSTSTSTPPMAIAPSNVLRQKAWGVASDQVPPNRPPNQEDATPAVANTEVISLDTDVRAKLSAAGAGGDPRFNYLLIGATWTLGGGEPTCPYPSPLNTQACPYSINDEIGTAMLSNSTMETFMQGTDTTVGTGTNCFTCHTSSGTDPNTKADTSVSHFFAYLNPLRP